jgi:hypothetical protein
LKEKKEKINFAGSKILPESIKEKDTQSPEVPWVSSKGKTSTA